MPRRAPHTAAPGRGRAACQGPAASPPACPRPVRRTGLTPQGFASAAAEWQRAAERRRRPGQRSSRALGPDRLAAGSTESHRWRGLGGGTGRGIRREPLCRRAGIALRRPSRPGCGAVAMATGRDSRAAVAGASLPYGPVQLGQTQPCPDRRRGTRYLRAPSRLRSPTARRRRCPPRPPRLPAELWRLRRGGGSARSQARGDGPALGPARRSPILVSLRETASASRDRAALALRGSRRQAARKKISAASSS